MILATYMALHSLSDAQMAQLIGHCTASGVRKWRLCNRIPRGKTIARIKQVTEGAVSPDDFFVLTKAAE